MSSGAGGAGAHRFGPAAGDGPDHRGGRPLETGPVSTPYFPRFQMSKIMQLLVA
jgi:hypothetical protein